MGMLPNETTRKHPLPGGKEFSDCCIAIALSIFISTFILLPGSALADNIELYLCDYEQWDVGSQHSRDHLCFAARGERSEQVGGCDLSGQKASQAAYILEGIYCYDHCVGESYAEVIRWIREAARQGYAGAQFNLGLMYKYACGVPQDFPEAFKWFSRSAAQGDSRAQFNLGLLYYSGQGVAEDHSAAAEWYFKAAEQGYVHAQSNLGALYFYGQGVVQDYGKAANWFHRAAEQGYAGAQYNLGLMCRYGQGLAQDYVKAHMWLSLSGIAGNEMAADTKEALALLMTSAQILESEKLVREWRSKKRPPN
jgi:TPR repeat protein